MCRAEPRNAAALDHAKGFCGFRQYYRLRDIGERRATEADRYVPGFNSEFVTWAEADKDALTKRNQNLTLRQIQHCRPVAL
jgi:hypothetical protein